MNPQIVTQHSSCLKFYGAFSHHLAHCFRLTAQKLVQVHCRNSFLSDCNGLALRQKALINPNSLHHWIAPLASCWKVSNHKQRIVYQRNFQISSWITGNQTKARKQITYCAYLLLCSWILMLLCVFWTCMLNNRFLSVFSLLRCPK